MKRLSGLMAVIQGTEPRPRAMGGTRRVRYDASGRLLKSDVEPPVEPPVTPPIEPPTKPRRKVRRKAGEPHAVPVTSIEYGIPLIEGMQVGEYRHLGVNKCEHDCINVRRAAAHLGMRVSVRFVGNHLFIARLQDKEVVEK